MSNKSELVWVISREFWNKHINFEGYKKDSQGDIYRMLLENGKFMERSEMEKDSNHKQVIPQGLLCCGRDVYVNERLPKQSETRLLYAYSLGVGGHLNPEDDLIPHMDLIQLGLHREMAEEVIVPRPFSIKYIGLTNDELHEVSSLHVGVWFQIELLSQNVSVKETEKLRGFWSNINDLDSISNKFESWAHLIYENHLK